MKLAIISHTEHYQTKSGEIVGWGPTITEINHLIDRFDEIIHVAFLHQEEPPPSSIAYQSDKIKFVALPPSGGRNLRDKLTVITHLPKTLSIVKKVLEKVDAFQFRAPVGIGVYLIPYLTYRVNKKGWFKYAGNWSQENAPLGYALQRKMLKKQNRKVTINGKWPNQPEHCLTFENPCLTLTEREEGKKVIENKTFTPKFTFCFVGRLEDEKGVQRIIDALERIENSQDFIEGVHLIGNGKKRKYYEKQVAEKALPIKFHGFLDRNKVFEFYKKSHFILLPSDSEGFPKVIAEAMAFGCIPIVSDISCIGQYVNNSNGFLIEPKSTEELFIAINKALKLENKELSIKVSNCYQLTEKFTFDYYNDRILEILAK